MKKARRPLGSVVACALAVMAVAVMVRLPSACIAGAGPDVREAYTSQEGLPYLTDADSYYHVRIVQNDLVYGSLGDTVSNDGTPWDSQSFYPEGRSAVYQPGIVRLTEVAWAAVQPLGLSLHAVEFGLAAVMSALVALAAFGIGLRMGGRFGGVVSGVLVACAPAFVARTTFGRFDTDMFVVLMDVLLLLAATEALRARRASGRIAWACAFGLVVYLYGVCWAAQYAMLFASLVLIGGLPCSVASPFAQKNAGVRTSERKDRGVGAPGRMDGGAGAPRQQGMDAAALGQNDVGARVARLIDEPPKAAGQKGPIVLALRLLCGSQLRSLLLCLVAGIVAIVALKGPEFFANIASAAAETTAVTAAGTFPNLYVSVDELVVPSLVPQSFLQWFVFAPGAPMTALNGAGGVVACAFALAGLACLVLGAAGRVRGDFAGRVECLVYACILGVFLAGSLYAVGRGVRFIEHLAVPVGILAGAFSSWVAHAVARESWGWRAASQRAWRLALCGVLLAATLAPTVAGSLQVSAATRPTVSDASAEAMAWVRENAADPQAVVASWWDKGYFYEVESGHPCLWDGGSMDGARAILVGKALTTNDFELSRRILLMLSGSGNRAVEFLVQHADASTAYGALWDALSLEAPQAAKLLAERCGLSGSEALQAEALVHPAPEKETYLVLTDTMMKQRGWFAYFANWDFAGGSASADDASGAAAARLHLGGSVGSDASGSAAGGFTRVFESDDGIERVTVWRVMSTGA